MRKRYSRSYTVLSFLTMFSYRELPLVARIFAVCYCRDDAAKPTTSVGNAMPATASGTIPPAYRHAATHLPLHKGANGCVNVPLKK